MSDEKVPVDVALAKAAVIAAQNKELLDLLADGPSDVSKTNELIAEAREWASSYASWGDNGLVDRLVDALEAALGEPPTCSDHRLVQHRDGKPPWCRNCGLDANGNEPVSRLGRHVQGEPGDELIEYALDYIENGTMRPERREALRALAARATVPDAATERVGYLEAELESRIDDRNYWHGYATKMQGQLEVALDAVERVRAAVEKHKHWNEGCGWDVPTIEVLAALDGAPEPEEKP